MSDSRGPSAGDRDSDVSPKLIADLILKLAHIAPDFSTRLVTERLCLRLSQAEELLNSLWKQQYLENLGEAGPLNRRMAITDKGRERARQLLEVSAYVGPVPVTLEAYTKALSDQTGQFPKVKTEEVVSALSRLVLADETVQVIALAISSARSLLLYGPPGDGKTSVGRMLHRALRGDLWVPHCIEIDGHIVQVFDSRFHKPVPLNPDEQAGALDRRWQKVQRPLIVAGGELRLEDLELSFDNVTRCYQLPIHLKANGGIFLLDDFGCQAVDSHRLLNRWIVPLEDRVDHLTLRTGQQMQVPFLQMLILSTNLDPNVVLTPALLRRMGYRLYIGDPSPERFERIFRKYAAEHGFTVPPDLLDWILQRHRAEGRPLRGCAPRDLIERCSDICRQTGQPKELSEELLDVAWRTYFVEGVLNLEPVR